MKILTTIVTVAALVCLAALTAVSVSGCASLPGAQQQVAVTVLVDASVGVAVQNGSSDPAVWAKRAATITGIATQLKAVDAGAISTLPLLTQALAPLILKANLGPADVLIANVLIGALSQFIQQNVPASQTQTTVIQNVLDTVIAAASVYVTPKV